MASAPFPIEDQTDEDFFNKLVEDDFGVGSGSDQGNIAGSVSSTSNGDMGVSSKDSDDLGCAIVEEDGVDNAEIQLPRVPENGSSKSFQSMNGVKALSFEEEKQGVGLTHDTANALASGNNGSKGVGVKAVNWSAFNIGSQQFDSGEFGSISDFSTDNEVGSKKELAALDDKNSEFIENSSDYSTYPHSSSQDDAQHVNSSNQQVGEVHNPQYWENLYPGWKFDIITQQWYQLQDCHVTSTSESGYYTSATVQQPYQDEVLDRNSNTYVLQQTVSSVVENIVQDCSTNDASNCYQSSYVNSKYPPNMVFDPSYPGWYYDTNTQQWYTVDSYTQTTQGAAGTEHQPLNQDIQSSNIISEMNNCKLENKIGQYGEENTQYPRSHVLSTDQDSSRHSYTQEQMWHPNQVEKSTMDFSGDSQQSTYNNLSSQLVNHTDQQAGHKNLKPSKSFDFGSTNGRFQFHTNAHSESMYQFDQRNLQETLSHKQYDNQNMRDFSQKGVHHLNPCYPQYTSVLNENRSSAGHPPHALVAFGFGGKLIVMKDSSSSQLDYGSQDATGPSISILNLIDIITSDIDFSSATHEKFKYFHALCQGSFPGPLVGGNASAKDVNKWVDDQIAKHQSPLVDSREEELLNLLLSLLKISCQHYGKLRSPFNFNTSIEDTDSPESAVAKLFSCVNKNGNTLQKHDHLPLCIQNLPTEGQLEATSLEVQRLLVSGRKKEALQCAQAGQLWGPALVLSAQFGDKYYVETVKQMAHYQFTSGSPLRTLYLLIAGQPAEVFSTESSQTTVTSTLQEPSKVLANGMLDDWERNVAIIAANRTKDDELVIIHLGDCLWKEKGQISAAHTCYLVSEVNLEPYSESARMCLIGADHWKLPRTYVSPEAIQRTELYEYSKVLGNSQFILLPFQPYKLVYAYMLAEVGKVSDSLRYCQTSLKMLKNSNRVPEVELWKSLFSSLEERARIHQQGGYNSSLDPTKLVGKLFTSIDRSISRIIGAPQSPMIPVPVGNENGKENLSDLPKVVNSQSSMDMSSLIQSGSEASNEATVKSNRKIFHNRSVSEPDFGRALKQDQLKDVSSPDSESKASRLGRFGSQILLKTVGWVSRSRPDRQAKLGERNKFYYDDKLKRWVEEGAELPNEGAALLPPPTTASFQNGMTNFNINNEFKTPTAKTNGVEAKSTGISCSSKGIPPISPSPNQFSGRGKMGVRSRYVDTFNKSGISLNASPSTPIVKPKPLVNVFLPGKPPTFDPQAVGMAADKTLEALITNGSSTTLDNEVSYSSAQPAPPSIQRIPSMDSITSCGTGEVQKDSRHTSSHSRAASWGGSYGNAFSFTEVKSWEDGTNE